MRSDIVPGAIFPDYELSDHTAKRRKLSELQGPHPMVLVLSRGGFCPKDRRQAEGLLGQPLLLSAKVAVRGCVMTIRPFLAGRAFDPETINTMSEALKGVCDTLSLKLADGPETRLVAQKIIELAQRGVQDVATLQTMTLNEFKYE
jgi:hypothetical protein